MAKGKVIVRDRGFDKMIRTMRAGDIILTVGVQPPAGAKVREGGLTNAQLMLIHEFGAPGANIPPRPIIKPTLKQSQPLIDKRTRQAAERFFDNIDIKTVAADMQDLGDELVRRMRKRMDSSVPPPLKPATAAKRLREGKGLTTLIDTGELQDSLSAVVRV